MMYACGVVGFFRCHRCLGILSVLGDIHIRAGVRDVGIIGAIKGVVDVDVIGILGDIVSLLGVVGILGDVSALDPPPCSIVLS